MSSLVKRNEVVKESEGQPARIALTVAKTNRIDGFEGHRSNWNKHGAWKPIRVILVRDKPSLDLQTDLVEELVSSLIIIGFDT